jgi:TetR/AcrR family transcriptional repressor of nem operon
MRQPGTRDHLLATGLRLLHGQGFHASGVQDIAEAAKVPKGTFYTHFDSKERFGAEVLGRYWEERADRAAALLSDETRPPIERLKAYFAAKTQLPRSFEKGCMIGNFSAEMAGESRLIRDRLQAGELRAELDPDTIAAFLIDAFEGALLRAKVDRDPTALRRFETIIFSTILT